MVGNDYQAQVPDGLISYDQVPANDAEDTLLWSSEPVHSQEVENYLRRAHEILKPTIPKGILLRDDEEALYLLQECSKLFSSKFFHSGKRRFFYRRL